MSFCSHSIITFRNKTTDLFFSLCNHCKRWCLHTSTGKLCIIFTGQCPCCIDSNQPVCLGTAHCSIIKRIILMPVLQLCKTFSDCFICYRRDPQPLDRLFASCFFQNQPCYQLSFSSCIRSNDNFIHILAVNLCFHRCELFSGLLYYFKLKWSRLHRKHINFPLFIFFIVIFRICQGNQMTKSPGYNITLSFNCSIYLFPTFKYTRNITRNRRFFCNYKCLHSVFSTPFYSFSATSIIVFNLSCASVIHWSNSGLNVPHSPFWIISSAFSCENAFL